MKYYNRDNYERNLESYQVPEYFTKGARNEFVYGFIVGAVIGSALGLVSISKSRSSNKNVPENKEQFKSNIVAQSEQEQQDAENKLAGLKSTIADSQKNNTEVSDKELAAQKVAIQKETSDNELANMSPEAQEQQEAKNENNKDDVVSGDLSTEHIDPDAEPTEDEVSAQQDAIKEETSDNTDAEVTSTADSAKNEGINGKTAAATAGGAIAAGGLASAAQNKKEALNNNSEVSENTSKLINEEDRPKESAKNAPNLVTQEATTESPSYDNDKSEVASSGAVSASDLALAANNKQQAINNNQNIADNTANLLIPESLKQAKHQSVPNLITPNIENAVESTDKVDNSADKNNKKATATEIPKPTAAEQRVTQTHKTVSFKDGIIVHENASRNLSEQSVAQGSTSNTTQKDKKASTESNDGIINHDESQTTSKVANSTKNNSSKNKSSKKTYTKNRTQMNKTEKAESKIDKRTFND
ncbi:hypothetical protein BU101_09490 [Staphylococcus shinii]|uniref:hypothetical protein n=1 Tax=Staphylococcus shinii TaxID=2912228 RepID=UPI000E6A4A72|nr:hypothetical protein [Staphylococcus shinii]RIN07289.1 hypothetical protein BU101_09490 [Staphylococcus shinii]